MSEVEDSVTEINEAERKKEKRIKRSEDNLGDFWDYVKKGTFKVSFLAENTKTDFLIHV